MNIELERIPMIYDHTIKINAKSRAELRYMEMDRIDLSKMFNEFIGEMYNKWQLIKEQERIQKESLKREMDEAFDELGLD